MSQSSSEFCGSRIFPVDLMLVDISLTGKSEFESFQLFGQGKGTREVADQLHLSSKTVELHRVNMKENLKVL